MTQPAPKHDIPINARTAHEVRLSHEVLRLREALERIAKGWSIMEADELSDIARQALEGGE